MLYHGGARESPILVSQRQHRIDPRRAAGGDVAGERGDRRASNDARAGDRQRIAAGDAVQLTARRSGSSAHDATRPSTSPDADQHQHLAHHQPDDVARHRAERHAHADLARAPRDRVRHHAVEADDREQRREHAERRRQRRDQPIVQQRLIDLVLQRPQVVDRDVGVELRARPARIAPNAASGWLVVRTYITAPPAMSFSMKAKNTWRGISSRTPVYFESLTTPMISIGVFVPGLMPKPMWRPIGLRSPK